MCRYAFHHYRSKYACFNCRKVFKQTNENALAQKMRTDAQGNRLATCPECNQPMHNMGLDFHTPRQADKKQWRKVALLYAHGFAYYSCGCGAGYRPATLAEVPAFLAAAENNRRHNERLRVKDLKDSRKQRR